MINKKKVVSFSLATAMVASMGMSAFAAPDMYTIKTTTGEYFQYDVKQLSDSYIELIDKALYNDFNAKLGAGAQFYAFHDDKTLQYVDYTQMAATFMNDPAAFNLNAYTENAASPVPADLPATVQQVEMNAAGTITTNTVSTGTTAELSYTVGGTMLQDAGGYYLPVTFNQALSTTASYDAVMGPVAGGAATDHLLVNGAITASKIYKAELSTTDAKELKLYMSAATIPNNATLGFVFKADAIKTADNKTLAAGLLTASKAGVVNSFYVEDALLSAIAAANVKANAAVAGTAVGNYPQSAIDAFKVAIANAQTVADNTASTQAQKDVALATLNSAEITFDAAKITQVSTLAVESVSAINGKQVSVTFSKDVDVTKLTKANFTITEVGTDAAGKDRLTDSATATNGIGTVNTGVIKAGSDAKTVVLTMDNTAIFTNGKTVSVTVTGVKDGEATMANVTKTAVLSDAAVPTVVKAESKASNEVRVVFSEPVYNGAADDYATDIKANNFTINDGAVAISTAVRDASNPNAVVITTTADLANGTEYTVKVNTAGGFNVQDYAGYKVMANAPVKFTHTVESAAATATAEAKTEKSVRLTFNKTVTIPANANIEFRYAYNATGANKVIADSSVGTITAVTGSNNTQYDLVFASPMAVGAGTIYINYTNPADATKSNVIKDGYGNVVPSGTAITFTVAADTTAPTAVVAYKDATNIDVTFSETVTGATSTTNYEVKDKDGKAVAITGITTVDATKNQYRLTVADMSAGGNYTVKIADGIKDISVNQNKFVTQTFTVAVPDTKKPTISSVTQNATGDKVYIYYSEEMGAAAVDVNNYRLVDSGAVPTAVQYALPTGTTITQVGSTVTITLPKTLAALKTDLGAANVPDKLFIGAVADKSGNQPVAMADHAITAYSATFTATITKSKLLSDKQASFVVDRQLKSVDATKIKKTGATTATSATFVNNADGTATVTATFATGTFGTDLTAASLDINLLALTDTNDLTNSAVANHAILADYAAPQIDSITTKDTGTANGKIDTIEVVFTENLYTASVQERDFTVAGYTITGVDTATAKTVKISVLEKGTADTAEKPVVTLVGEVEDAVTVTADQPSRNKLAGSATKTTVDGVAPVVVSAVRTGAKALTITFSEPVYSDGSASSALEIADVLYSPIGVAGTNEAFAGLTHTAGAATLTTTLTTDATVGTSTVGSAAAAVFDAAGNNAPTFADGTVETVVQ